MKLVCVSVLVWLAAQALPVGAADAGIYTIVEGNARVLRGATWSKLMPGVRAQEGDVLDLPEGAVAQSEMPRGGSVNVTGPAAVLVAALPGPAGKAGTLAEWTVLRGWVKAAADASGLRVRTPQGSVDFADAIVVVKVDANAMQMFVESGGAKVTPAGVRVPAREVRAGELWSRTDERPFSIDTRAPPAFVAGMPRPYLDALPKLASRMAGPAPALKALAPITFAEAEPWLTGPYRGAFVRRLTSRLSDSAFRVAVESRAATYPEWDRMLHPERYP